MHSKIAFASALLPVALACNGYEDGIPAETGHISSDAPIEIAAGEVFDAGWVKYDRGAGACGSGEGGKWKRRVTVKMATTYKLSRLR